MHEAVRRFSHLIFSILLLFLYFLRLLQKEPFMSTERFDIRHAPAPRESFRLLYISKSKFGGDSNSTAHTNPAQSCSTV